MLSKIKYYIRQYFGFSRGQTHGVVVLLLLLVVALAIPRLIHEHDIREQKKDILQSAAALDALVKELEQAKGDKQTHVAGRSGGEKVCFDINTACEDDLKKLYGIGPVRAERIIAYRNRLGGFVDAAQYAEVYNLPDDVVARLQQHAFISADFIPKQMDLNKASLQALASHPYFTYSKAKAVTAYRAQHGEFHRVQDLEKVKCIDAATLKKLLPYLTVTS